MFGSRIPVMKLLEKLRADTVAARGVHKRGMRALRRRAGRPDSHIDKHPRLVRPFRTCAWQY